MRRRARNWFPEWSRRCDRQQSRPRWTRGEVLVLLVIAIAAMVLPHPLPSPETMLAYLRELWQGAKSR